MGATLFAAPYEYVAHNNLARAYNEPVEPWRGTVHAPVWSPPSADEVNGTLRQRRETTPGSLDTSAYLFTKTDDVRLDTGQLALWWAGIAAVTGVGALFARPMR
jgi:hypothetical protein